MDLRVAGTPAALAAALGLDSARAADPERYRIGERAPRRAVRPVSREEVAEVLRAAARDRLGVIPWGGGTRLSRAAVPERFDVALDLSALTRVIAYEPEDLTLTAECGATLGALRATLAARGQELPLESAHAARATLGGALAANTSGSRRLRYGAPRDRILGARFALGDGTVAQSGGRVVKNVAGFALHRLLCGSAGGLAVILEASLKLMPAPEARRALIYGVTRQQLADSARWSGLPRLEPAFVTVLGAAAAEALRKADGAAAVATSFVAVVGLEDDAGWVAEQERRIVAVWGAPASRLEGAAVVELSQHLADAEDHGEPRLTFTSAHNSPAAIAALLDQSGVERLVLHTLAGRLHWFPEPGTARGVVDRLAALGFTLIAARAAGEIAPALAPQEGVRALRERIREALDPTAAFALGSRWAIGSPS